MTDQQKMFVNRAHSYASAAKDYARAFEALQEQIGRVAEAERQLESAREELTRLQGLVELGKGELVTRLPVLP